MAKATVNGIELYYEVHGSGEPLLLIMGLSGHTMAWLFQTSALAQHYQVIVFDNRGAGQSEAPEGPYSIRQMAEDAAGLLDHLGIARAKVVGWSMGGMIAQELALNYPEKVERLVLMASVAHVPETSRPWLTFGEQARAQELDPRGLVLWSLPWMFTAAFMTQPEMVEAALNQSALDPFPITAQGFSGQAAACRAHNALDRLDTIATPTLVLVGAEDILTPPAYSREMAERIPGARLQILERCGHGMPIEFPQVVNAALLAFLAESVPAPATA
jgi:3-oxoadipate enol-lactonase